MQQADHILSFPVPEVALPSWLRPGVGLRVHCPRCGEPVTVVYLRGIEPRHEAFRRLRFATIWHLESHIVPAE